MRINSKICFPENIVSPWHTCL